MKGLYVETLGTGPRIVLVHGSISPGWGTWEAQRPLAERFRLVLPHRSGYPPNPSLERIDFERQAEETAALLEPGDHLAGHSYGGVVTLLAAARRPEAVRSLTVIEPPAFGMAAGDPVVAAASLWFDRLFVSERDPARLLPSFLRLLGGAAGPRRRLSPALEAGVRALMSERPPSEARVPLAALRAASIPTLVVSSGEQPPFEAICHALAEALGAERAVIPGAGHAVQRTGAPFNERFVEFLERAEAAASSGAGAEAADTSQSAGRAAAAVAGAPATRGVPLR